MEADVATNFDIAATRNHFEQFIGRVYWGILNSVWPSNRMDILLLTCITLAHTVNLTNPSIGPKK